MSEFDTRARADRRLFPDKYDGRRWTYREGLGDEIRFMARHSGYVMVRKPRCTPFVLMEREWLKLPLFTPE